MLQPEELFFKFDASIFVLGNLILRFWSQPRSVHSAINCELMCIFEFSDVVFFGESLPSRFWSMSKVDFENCDLLLVNSALTQFFY